MRDLSVRLQVAGELLVFLWSQRIWWMIPLAITLIIGALLFSFGSGSALAPFLYPLF